MISLVRNFLLPEYYDEIEFQEGLTIKEWQDQLIGEEVLLYVEGDITVKTFFNHSECFDGDRIVGRKDQLTFVIVPEGGEFFRLILFSVLTAALPVLPVFGLTGFGASLLRAGYALVGSMLINALIPPRPSSPEVEVSPSYSFDGVQNTSQYGIAIPVVYGEHRVGGNVISLTIEGEGKTQRMHLLLGLAEGEIEQISDVLLDEQPATTPGVPIGEEFDDYSAGTPLEGSGLMMAMRPGTPDQTSIKAGTGIEFDDETAQNVFSEGGRPGVLLNIVQGDIKTSEGDSIVADVVTDDEATFEVEGVIPGDEFFIGNNWNPGQMGMLSGKVTEVISETQIRINNSMASGKFGKYSISGTGAIGQPPPSEIRGSINFADGDSITGTIVEDLGGQFITRGVEVDNFFYFRAYLFDGISEPVLSVDDETQLTLDGVTLNGKTGSYFIQHRVVRQATKLGKDYDKAYITLLLPRGAAYLDGNNTKPWITDVMVEYREIGDVTWIPIPDQVGLAGTPVEDGIVSFSTTKLETWSETFRVHEEDDVLPLGQYEFRFTRLSAKPTGLVNEGNTEVRLLYITEALTGELNYPHTALLALRSVANAQISGRLPLVTCMMKGRKIYDPRTDTVAWSDNPALATRDVLLAHLDPTGWSVNETPVQPRIDDDSFNDWADFCEVEITYNELLQKRCRCDIVLDVTQSTWDTLKVLSSVGRAFVLQDGTRYGVVIDRETEPSQLFTYASIRENTYRMEYLPNIDRAETVEVTYLDRESNWKKNLLHVPDTEDIYLNSPVGVDAWGVTRFDQAVRHGKMHLLNSQTQIYTASFEVSYEALTALVGDVIKVSHDTVQRGYGGRVLANDGLVLTIDRLIEDIDLTGWVFLVRLPDDTIVERTVVSQNEREFTLDEAIDFEDMPVFDSIYTLGELVTSVEELRILRTGRTQEGFVKLQCVPYDEAIYALIDDDTYLPVERTQSTSGRVEHVANLFVEEVSVFENGVERIKIAAQWTYEFNYYGADVYVQINNGALYKEGTTMGTFYEFFPDIVAGDWIKVVVCALRQNGQPLSLLTAPFYSFVVQGYSGTNPIPNVLNFRASRTGDDVLLEWDPVDHQLFSHYEIRRGYSWDTATIISSPESTNYTDTFIGETWYLIRAFDTNGFFSELPASVFVEDNGAVPAVEQLEHDTWTGTKTDCAIVTISGEDLLRADDERLVEDPPEDPDMVYITPEIDALSAGTSVYVDLLPFSQDMFLTVDDLVESVEFYSLENNWSVLGSHENLEYLIEISSNAAPAGSHTYGTFINGGEVANQYVKIRVSVFAQIQHKSILKEMTTRIF